jgi:hypothetical protein
LRFTVGINLTWEREGKTQLPSEWISRRKQEYSEAKLEFERQRRLDREATATSDGLFDQVKEQVGQDIQDYNAQFPDCPASFSKQRQGFAVHCRGRNASLEVTKEAEETTIQYQISHSSSDPLKDSTRTGHLSIKANYDTGNMEIRTQKRSFTDVAGVSEFLLDLVLCGPKDYTKRLKSHVPPSD